ncbi:MAG: undecaprenyl-phosphate glucose phosphotransferase [Candidatus Eisenbacteria bacterium]|nr:undecaprenyl-phosphate glucose phosphotransferase [Candidatus Eisenbacteria bacterium]
MFARSRQLFASAMFVLDAALVAAAWLVAYWLRFFALPIEAPLGVPPLRLYLWACAVLVPMSLLVLRSFRLYRSARTARLGHELLSLTQSLAVTSALAALGSYLVRGELSRLVIILFFFTAVVMFTLSRLALRAWLRSVRRSGRNLRHVLIVGTGPLAELVLEKIRRHRDFGLAVHGLIAADPALVGTEVRGAPVIGVIDDLPRLADEQGVEIIYLALSRPEWQAEERALQLLSDSTAAVRLVPDLSQAYRLNPSVEDFDGMPVVLVTESPEQGWNAVVKRAFDLVGSFVGLLLISPLLALLAILVRLDSPGPILYTQERVGLNGRRFRMIKFRSMRVGADANLGGAGGAGWTTVDDPRRTRLGATLRKLSLDELPQLWNVLVGDMSLVGPRPEQPEHVDRFRASIPRYMLRHHVRAGMTGWAQVNGLRGDTPLEDRIQYDLYYIEHWSLVFDLRILLLTVGRVFRDASAY